MKLLHFMFGWSPRGPTKKTLCLLIGFIYFFKTNSGCFNGLFMCWKNNLFVFTNCVIVAKNSAVLVGCICVAKILCVLIDCVCFAKFFPPSTCWHGRRDGQGQRPCARYQSTEELYFYLYLCFWYCLYLVFLFVDMGARGKVIGHMRDQSCSNKNTKRNPCKNANSRQLQTKHIWFFHFVKKGQDIWDIC